MAMLHSAVMKGGEVELGFGDGRPDALLPLLWLRDNCTSPASQHPETKQRLVDTFNIPSDLAADAVAIEDQGRTLRIDWARDGHVSRFDSEFLAGLRFNPDVLPIIAQPWDHNSIAHAVPQVSYDGFLNDDAVLKEFLEHVAAQGFCFVEGVPGTSEGTKAVAARISYIRETIFGGYWDFTANMEHKDTAYTSMAIGPHTDGTYSFDAPGYQMFHCLAADCTGGENILIDGFKIAQLMLREHPEDFQVLRTVAIPGQYIDQERGIHLMARRPLFRHDDAGNLVQVSYNNYDRASFSLPGNQQSAFYRALATFDRAAIRQLARATRARLLRRLSSPVWRLLQ